MCIIAVQTWISVTWAVRTGKLAVKYLKRNILYSKFLNVSESNRVFSVRCYFLTGLIEKNFQVFFFFWCVRLFKLFCVEKKQPLNNFAFKWKCFSWSIKISNLKWSLVNTFNNFCFSVWGVLFFLITKQEKKNIIWRRKQIIQKEFWLSDSAILSNKPRGLYLNKYAENIFN